MRAGLCLETNLQHVVEEEEVSDVDVVLDKIGPLGRFQLCTAILMWLPGAAAGIAVVAFVFTAYEPSHRCVVPQCETPNATYFLHQHNQTLADHVRRVHELGATSNCKRINIGDNAPLTHAPTCDQFLSILNGSNSLTYCSREELIFDESIVRTSLVRDFGLTCEWKFLRSFYSATYMAGMLAGSFVLGVISDRYGRMKALMLSIFLVSVAGTVAAFVAVPAVFGVLRFITGMGGMGCFMVTFVLVVETTTPKYAVLLTSISNVGFMLGEVVLTLEAYLVRDWVHLQVLAHAPLAVGLLLWLVVPESARWLVANGRTRHANVVLASMARVNGKKLDLAQVPKSATSTEVVRPRPRLLDLLRPRAIFLRTINMSYQWASVTMTFYGLLFSLTSLSGDPYLNFFLGALLELPGILFSYFCTDWLGRRWMLTLLQGLAGVACIGSGLLEAKHDLSALQTCFALMGRFATTAGFGTVYLYAAELYPTAIRNAAMGTFSTFARVGGIVALLLGALSTVWPPLPMVIMGAVSTLACALALLFPETTGQHLPETIQDALDLDSKTSTFRPCSFRRNTRGS